MASSDEQANDMSKPDFCPQCDCNSDCSVVVENSRKEVCVSCGHVFWEA